ncbi:MAG: hypothetical protein L5656_01890 [Thermanaeromonas sp.]|uniref:hypothetical protein n=1 Tax=Thermanaeromonas sp. TaxID=2003697 RepID=UPI00243E8921|nr:hypothetical protein [Thermanaeromonas sp.]MCG0277275.1 hypothetical protein [Thermanaeromonas sp.]
MLVTVGAVSLLLLLFYGALKAKMRAYRVPHNGENLPSPASRALAELVGIAGGIYLSLVMLVSFLKLGVPETVSLGGWSMDPLALLAVLVALIQPLILAWWPGRKKR